MTDRHNQSFFGQATGLTLMSSSNSESHIFIRCIKKKQDGIWEKPSQGEGKTIKCGLEEIVMMLQVLSRKIPSWSIFHSFKDIKTSISFKWEEQNDQRFWINIGNYSKSLSIAQVEIFRMLLEHLLHDKIEFATVSTHTSNSRSQQTNKNQINNSYSVEEAIVQPTEVKNDRQFDVISAPKRNNSNDAHQVAGSIKSETQKALLISFNDDQEVWIPKSIIRSSFSSNQDVHQDFLIDDWILKKNNITA